MMKCGKMEFRTHKSDFNFFFAPGVRLAYAPCAPHVRLMCARLGADGYLRFSLVS
jgi:hypothetical protein